MGHYVFMSKKKNRDNIITMCLLFSFYSQNNIHPKEVKTDNEIILKGRLSSGNLICQCF